MLHYKLAYAIHAIPAAPEGGFLRGLGLGLVSSSETQSIPTYVTLTNYSDWHAGQEWHNN